MEVNIETLKQKIQNALKEAQKYAAAGDKEMEEYWENIAEELSSHLNLFQ